MKDFQKCLQMLIGSVIGALGLYILYRGVGIVMESPFFKNMGFPSLIQRYVEEEAASVWLPGLTYEGYEKRTDGNWLTQFVEEEIPFYRVAQSQIASSNPKTIAEETSKQKEKSEEENQAEKKEEQNQIEEKNQQETSNQIREQEPAQIQKDDKEQGEGENQDRVNEQNDMELQNQDNEQNELEVPIKADEQIQEPETVAVTAQNFASGGAVAGRNPVAEIPYEQLGDFDFVLNQYYILDASTTIDASLLNAETFMEKDFSIEKDASNPQILIYHTHSQEDFVDSVPGDDTTTIVGVGDYLAELLETTYGYHVIHDRGVYDLVDGVLDREAAYDYSLEAVEQILTDNPSIEVVIDLHRDGVEGKKLVTQVNGEDTAPLMLFNGLSRLADGEEIAYLPNPYLEDNLAFSFQLQMKAEQFYPDLMRPMYLRGYRYNLHVRPRALLVESGTQLNTLQEEKNAMKYLADILNQVLSGE